MLAKALSRLTLETVQFGLPYGVANRAGQPSYETARDILACAIEGGVTCLDTAVLGRALARGMAVFARSVYLQGLVLLPDAATPDDLCGVIPARRQFAELARDAGIPLAELALRYVLTLGDLTSILVGVESVDQMRENLALFEKGPLPQDIMRAVVATVPSLPDAILDPWRWTRRMPDAKPKA